jgi:hypothetical protein
VTTFPVAVASNGVRGHRAQRAGNFSIDEVADGIPNVIYRGMRGTPEEGRKLDELVERLKKVASSMEMERTVRQSKARSTELCFVYIDLITA